MGKLLQGFADSDVDIETLSMQINQPVVIDFESAEISLVTKLTPVIKQNNELLLEFLQKVYGFNFNMLMDYTALFAFEDRTGIPRPTLVMLGGRGSGKSLFPERFLSSIYKGTTVPIPADAEKYGSWKLNKLVIIDENEADRNSFSSIYTLLKKWSSEKETSVRQMYGEAFSIKAGFYPVVISNKHPFNIEDVATSETNNQFMVINVDPTPIDGMERTAWIHSFKSRFAETDYDDFFSNHVGHFVRTWLWEHYKKIKADLYGKASRYGIKVPITERYRRLCDLSITQSGDRTEQFIDYILYTDIEQYDRWQDVIANARTNPSAATIPNGVLYSFAEINGIKYKSLLHSLANIGVTMHRVGSPGLYKILNSNNELVSERGRIWQMDFSAVMYDEVNDEPK